MNIEHGIIGYQETGVIIPAGQVGTDPSGLDVEFSPLSAVLPEVKTLNITNEGDA